MAPASPDISSRCRCRLHVLQPSSAKLTTLSSRWLLGAIALISAVVGVRSAASLPTPDAAGQSLTVDTANGNSPYPVTADDSFSGIIAGNTSAGVVNQSAGTLTVSGGLTMAYGSNSNGAYYLSDTGRLTTGPVAIGLQGTASFTQSGTSIFSVAPASLLYLGYSPGSSGVYQLNAGTLKAGTVTGNSGTSTFNFNGGTLQAARGSFTFFQGLTAANIQAGGAVIDTNGFNVTIAQILQHDSANGAPVIDGGLTKQAGGGTLALSGANTFTGATTINTGTLNLLNPLALQNSTLNLSDAPGSGTLTFDGTVTAKAFTLGGLAGNGNLALVNNASTPVAIALSVGNNGASATYSGVLSGSGSLVKVGAGTETLSGTNTYTGATTVSVGTLSCAVADLSNTAAVNLTSGSTLNLAFTGTNTISQITIDGVLQSSGTWGGLGSSATYRTPAITGPGTLTTTTGAATQPYASWAASYALPGGKDGFQQDADNDGISNGLEWILGGNPTVPNATAGALATYSASQITLAFTRLDATEGMSNLSVDWSPDLVTWTSAQIGAASSTTSQGIAITIVENGTSPDSVSVAVPRSLGTDGRLFVRLRATLN